MPCSGSPNRSSYTYPHFVHTHAAISEYLSPGVMKDPNRIDRICNTDYLIHMFTCFSLSAHIKILYTT